MATIYDRKLSLNSPVKIKLLHRDYGNWTEEGFGAEQIRFVYIPSGGSRSDRNDSQLNEKATSAHVLFVY